MSSRESTTRRKPSGTPAKGKKKDEKKEPAPKQRGFEMPAFSIPTKTDRDEKEKQKKKVMRRNKPPGEDLAKLKDICRSVREKKVTVQEFIALVAPSTGDNGELLKNILVENLATFRSTARRIYDTMTQDISDVLTNEHIQLTEGSNEKTQLYNEKEMRLMGEIYQLCPDFDIKRYYLEKGYLTTKFPLAAQLIENSDEENALMRQEAYHRYQWLKTEGERLKDENAKLQKRMSELKKQQKQELRMAAEREKEAEQEREKLEEKQEELSEQLDELNKSVEKALVETEDANTQKVVKMKRKMLKDSDAVKLPKQRVKEKPSETWAELAAAEIQTTSAADELKLESSKGSLRSKASSSKTSVKKKKKPLRRKPEFQEDAFHYSPPKEDAFHYSPPREEAFHYSPPKSPEISQLSEARAPSPRKRVETTTTVVEPQEQSRFGRGRAPRDSWGGFY